SGVIAEQYRPWFAHGPGDGDEERRRHHHWWAEWRSLREPYAVRHAGRAEDVVHLIPRGPELRHGVGVSYRHVREDVGSPGAVLCRIPGVHGLRRRGVWH